MPLPAVFDKATVHGKYVNLDGSVPTGTVTFVGGILLRATGVDTLILPSAFTVTLNGTGDFTILLPTTDDPDITPFDWQYQVTESFNTFSRTYYLEVPWDTVGIIEIADLEVPLGGNVAVERGRYVESIAGQVGTVTLANLATGTASSSTFLRGDGTWAVPSAGTNSDGGTASAPGARVQLRRSTTAQWSTTNPTLLAGELGEDTTTGRLKIGDGTTAWSLLKYLEESMILPNPIVVTLGGATSKIWVGGSQPTLGPNDYWLH